MNCLLGSHKQKSDFFRILLSAAPLFIAILFLFPISGGDDLSQTSPSLRIDCNLVAGQGYSPFNLLKTSMASASSFWAVALYDVIHTLAANLVFSCCCLVYQMVIVSYYVKITCVFVFCRLRCLVNGPIFDHSSIKSSTVSKMDCGSPKQPSLAPTTSF